MSRELFPLFGQLSFFQGEKEDKQFNKNEDAYYLESHSKLI